MRGRRRIDSSSIIAHPVNFETSLKCDAKNSTYICIYIRPLDNRYRFCISVQPEIDCTTFHIFLFEKKKCFLKFQKLTGLWLAGVVVNHVGIYGSKVAEGLSAFQRRSCCWWVLSDCAIRETSDQRGKCHEITFLIFTFHLNQRHIGARIIPCRCISIKNDFQWGPCWPIYRQPKPSPDCGRKIQNESNNVHIATYSCKPELISWR